MKKWDKRLVILLLISFVLFGANLSGISVYILDEAKNSVAAREMLEGDGIVPTFNYELRTDKPPLHYYFMMLAYRIFGVNEFAARFFSAVCGICLVISTYWFSKRFLDKRSGFWAALVLLCSIQVIIQFHMAVPDPYLILFLTLAMFSSYAFYQERKSKWIYFAYVFISLAMLAKGPVAIVLAGVAWVTFLLVLKDLSWKTIAAFRPFHGLLIIGLLVAPWYIAVHVQTAGAWTEGFFFKHNLGRFTAPMEGHGGSFLLIPVYVILGLLPFSLFIVPAIRLFWRKRSDPFLMLAAIMAAIVIVFFSLSKTKLPGYPAPCFPFVAILLGYYLQRKSESQSKKLLVIYLFYFIIMLAVPIAIFIVLEDVMGLAEIRNLAWWFVFLPVGAALAICFFMRNQNRNAFLSIGISSMLTCAAFFHFVYPEIDKRNAVNQSLSLITPQDRLYYFENFNPAFSFYAQRKITRLTDSTRLAPGRLVVLSKQKAISSLDTLQHSFQLVQTKREFFEPYFSSVLFDNNRKISRNESHF